jgi:AcrR family transcriptional regulator
MCTPCSGGIQKKLNKCLINIKQSFNFVLQSVNMEFNDKQVQIIETAEKLFADNGFDGTSVRDIAEEAGVNVAMISYYFGSKEKLLHALFIYRAEGTTQVLEGMLQNKELDPLQKVNVMIDYFIDKFHNQHCFHKIMMREQVANQKNATSEMIQDFKKRNQQLVKQLIQEGQKSGDFNKNIDVPILMATLIGTVSNLVTTQHFYREINNLQNMPDEQFQKLIRKKLSTHLKFLFKAILTHEI